MHWVEREVSGATLPQYLTKTERLAADAFELSLSLSPSNSGDQMSIWALFLECQRVGLSRHEGR